jgi:hypothetical protein
MVKDPVIDLKARMGGRSIALLFPDFGTGRGGGKNHAPAALPPVKTRYPL